RAARRRDRRARRRTTRRTPRSTAPTARRPDARGRGVPRTRDERGRRRRYPRYGARTAPRSPARGARPWSRAPLEEVAEPREQVARVVRARARFGMVLD